MQEEYVGIRDKTFNDWMHEMELTIDSLIRTIEKSSTEASSISRAMDKLSDNLNRIDWDIGEQGEVVSSLGGIHEALKKLNKNLEAMNKRS